MSIWVPPETDLETRVQGQAVDLGGAGVPQQENGEGRWKGDAKQISQPVSARMGYELSHHCGQLGLNSVRKLRSGRKHWLQSYPS